MSRTFLYLLQFVALIGLGLSAIGWVVISVTRILELLNGPLRKNEVDMLLYVLGGMKDAAVTLLLSGILLAVCEIALRLVPRTTSRDAH